ncbi:IDEAL domain-containing protein [Gracilibacillus sp. S3-1-1]|uniref:IDEAL domain-containing protein n=1 Tax=Gracilibacillus pellucidus TaxID=3095368 RepID=A0ACC6M0W2_9BACI|nr:IDEAL domain-containing protein [Gracilibacillus sp. S3-1-1]MDX8044579.1 IDEAL domain-containing protein [Gracilibacillus sp. S3-1-1]
MLSVKMLKPYYVKEEEKYIRVVLAYQYFSLLMVDEIYHFVPLEGREIRFNRVTQQIENEQDVFVFQKGNKFNRIMLADLMKVKDFQEHLNPILNPYMIQSLTDEKNDQIDQVIMALERTNLLRLIDQSLDEQNEEKFQLYTKILNDM